jgi:hypothetical protein
VIGEASSIAAATLHRAAVGRPTPNSRAQSPPGVWPLPTLIGTSDRAAAETATHQNGMGDRLDGMARRAGKGGLNRDRSRLGL